MKERLTLLHYPDNNPNNRGVFNDTDCPDPTGFPKFLYRTYEFDSRKSSVVFEALMKIKSRLVELSILPSPQNEKMIFPTQEEISCWNKITAEKVISRIELI